VTRKELAALAVGPPAERFDEVRRAWNALVERARILSRRSTPRSREKLREAAMRYTDAVRAALRPGITDFTNPGGA
jgi:predicted membrane chloride channel (bestrophin family)